MNKLYGDGIHDDTLAIQELIDSGVCEVVLPVPKAFYLISKPLELPSDFRLALPRYAEIRLAKGSNCVMVKNRLDYAPDCSEACADDLFTKYVHIHKNAVPCKNIELIGGIWNFNNLEQAPNPIQIRDDSIPDFTGFGMLFYKINGFKMSALTLKNPTNFAVNLDTVSYFTVEDITFDFNLGNPAPINMDGIHLDGNCHYGVIRNLKGACYDDLVALNAEEGSRGPITNILIDGIFAEECHSAVRLLTVSQKLEKIHIANVYGSYYQYCIGITKYYQGETVGMFDAITLDNIYASKAIRHDYIYPNPNSYVYPLIYISAESVVNSLKINTLHRREYNNPIDTLYIGKSSVVRRLILDDIVTENHTDSPMPFMDNEGTIQALSMRNISVGSEELITGNGEITERIEL